MYSDILIIKDLRITFSDS